MHHETLFCQGPEQVVFGVAFGGFMRTAVFDLDGTLVDTSGDMIAAANWAFTTLGHAPPLNASDHAEIAFAGGRAMVRAGVEILELGWSDAQKEEGYRAFLERYSSHLDALSTPYPGVEGCLDTLTHEGWRLAVCTNKPTVLAERLLVSLGLRQRFQSMIGADTLSVRKPDAAPVLEAITRAGGNRERAAMIGDTITDRLAAKSAGIPCVLVTFGPSGDAVARFEPEGLVSAMSLVPEVLGAIVR